MKHFNKLGPRLGLRIHNLDIINQDTTLKLKYARTRLGVILFPLLNFCIPSIRIIKYISVINKV